MAARDPLDLPPEPTPENIWLTPESLRVLAHPLRSRLLAQLRMGGPATATDLAAKLDTNSGATSYHLRKLESVGSSRTPATERASVASGAPRRGPTRGTRASSPATRTRRPP